MIYSGLPNLGVDDFAVLKTLSENRALGSFGYLLDSVDVISASYGRYVAVGGNPWGIPGPVDIPDNLKRSLITHYEGEIKGLEYISKIRNEIRTDVCPLCGSTKPPGQVDHFIPKEDYPEFSFFIPNLVSACDCNLHKGKNYKGQINGERLLHPYFDRCMSERLIYLSFDGDVGSPEIEIKVMPAFLHNTALNYHVQTIHAKTKLLTYAANVWAKISNTPRLHLSLKKAAYPRVSHEILSDRLNEMREISDDKHSTPNNWDSAIYFGLSKSNRQIEYLIERIESEEIV